MTFGQKITVGVLVAVFVFGLIGFLVTHQLVVLALAGFAMMVLLFGYAISTYE